MNSDLEEVTVFVLCVALVAGLVWLVIALQGPTCTAIEPDGDRETISCPAGWAEDEERAVKEDEYDTDE